MLKQWRSLTSKNAYAFPLKPLLSADLLPNPSWNSIFPISSRCPLLKNKQVLTACLLTTITSINEKTAHIQVALDIPVDQQIHCFPFHPVVKKISWILTVNLHTYNNFYMKNLSWCLDNTRPYMIEDPFCIFMKVMHLCLSKTIFRAAHGHRQFHSAWWIKRDQFVKNFLHICLTWYLLSIFAWHSLSPFRASCALRKWGEKVYKVNSSCSCCEFNRL